MSARLIDDDPALAHEHAQAAMRHAGRVGVVRETVAVTAYAVGDFALALRELRTHRRITGSNESIALIVDAERGVGRPEKALEEGRAVDPSALSLGARVQLAIAMSGARLDLGQTDLALAELDVDGVDPDRAFDWSPGFFAAKAEVLEELGEVDDAAIWRRRASVAEEALYQERAEAGGDVIEIDEIEEVRSVQHDDRFEDDDDLGAARESDESNGEDQSEGEETEAQEPEAQEAEAQEAEAEEAPESVEDEVTAILRAAGIDPDDDAPAESTASVEADGGERDERGAAR